MRQCSEDLVELVVALRLATLGAAAAPQQAHLELRLEDLVYLCLLLESWRRWRKRRRKRGKRRKYSLQL